MFHACDLPVLHTYDLLKLEHAEANDECQSSRTATNIRTSRGTIRAGILDKQPPFEEVIHEPQQDKQNTTADDMYNKLTS